MGTRYRLQIIVILIFIGISFARQARTEPLNFSVNVIVNSGHDYFTGETIAIIPSTEFTMNFSLELGESWIQTTLDPEYQSTKSWLYLNSSLSLSPFTSQLLSVAGDIPLQYSNQSFARQVYTDYFDPNHYDAYDRSLHLAEGFNFYDTQANRRYQYWRGLTITSLAPLSRSDDVSIFDQNTLSDFIIDALSGNSDYRLYFFESGIWQDLTTYAWGAGYLYTSNNVTRVSLISEPSTFLQLAIGLISLALTYCSRMKKPVRRRSKNKGIFITRAENTKHKRMRVVPLNGGYSGKSVYQQAGWEAQFSRSVGGSNTSQTQSTDTGGNKKGTSNRVALRVSNPQPP